MTASTPLLIERLFPGSLRIPASQRLLLQVVAGVVFLTLLAQVRIPIGPVPFTGQTLAVLLLGAAFGARLGAVTTFTYLIVGAAGLPVFQGWQAGLSYVAGPTGGYLVAFPLAAAVVGFFAQHGWNRSPVLTALAMLAGNAVIYVPGLLWLNTFMPTFTQTLGAGLVPFVVGDLLKLGLAAALLPTAWALLGDRR